MKRSVSTDIVFPDTRLDDRREPVAALAVAAWGCDLGAPQARAC
jgi:hypothetical protein